MAARTVKFVFMDLVRSVSDPKHKYNEPDEIIVKAGFDARLFHYFSMPGGKLHDPVKLAVAWHTKMYQVLYIVWNTKEQSWDIFGDLEIEA